MGRPTVKILPELNKNHFQGVLVRGETLLAGAYLKPTKAVIPGLISPRSEMRSGHLVKR